MRVPGGAAARPGEASVDRRMRAPGAGATWDYGGDSGQPRGAPAAAPPLLSEVRARGSPGPARSRVRVMAPTPLMELPWHVRALGGGGGEEAAGGARAGGRAGSGPRAAVELPAPLLAASAPPRQCLGFVCGSSLEDWCWQAQPFIKQTKGTQGRKPD